MNRRAALLPLVLFAAVGFAQEGHPLTGTWHGEWSAPGGPQARIVMALRWDTKNVVGILNPGPHSVPFEAVTLDPEKWMVHFEADTKDKAGNTVHVVANGKLDNIGSYNRTITGTWTEGSVTGEFKVTRD